MIRLCLLIVWVAGSNLNAQPAKFELNNPNAIKLTKAKLDFLVGKTWYLKNSTFFIRGNSQSYKAWSSIKYYHDGRFVYGAQHGSWKLIDKRYFYHKFDSSNTPRYRATFGGTYAVTQLTDTSLVLTKLLSSSHDMKISLYLSLKSGRDFQNIVHQDSNRTAPKLNHNIMWQGGPLNREMIDKISRFSNEDLFIRALRFSNDTIFIQTPDSLYKIKRKIK